MEKYYKQVVIKYCCNEKLSEASHLQVLETDAAKKNLILTNYNC